MHTFTHILIHTFILHKSTLNKSIAVQAANSANTWRPPSHRSLSHLIYTTLTLQNFHPRLIIYVYIACFSCSFQFCCMWPCMCVSVCMLHNAYVLILQSALVPVASAMKCDNSYSRLLFHNAAVTIVTCLQAYL